MDRAALREDMVDSLQHESKGCIESPRLALAMREVPRHEFVDAPQPYADVKREINGSTVLAPSLVATLFEQLGVGEEDSVLIVGAGVGYTAAVAAELSDATNVHAVDIDRSLVYLARRNLAKAGYGAVLVDCRDGATGLPEYAPYDRILLEAAAIEPPRPLLEQLTPTGRLVLPKGTPPQELVTVEGGHVTDRGPPVRFKPLLVEGEQGTAIERNRTHREDRERAQQANHARTGWELEWIDW